MIYLAAVIAVFGAFFWASYVLWILVGWFLVPIGFPDVSYLHTCGIALVIGMFTTRSKLDAPWDVAILYIAPTLTLGVGYVIHLYQ